MSYCIHTLVLNQHDHDGAAVLDPLLGQALAMVHHPAAHDQLELVLALVDEIRHEAHLRSQRL